MLQYVLLLLGTHLGKRFDNFFYDDIRRKFDLGRNIQITN